MPPLSHAFGLTALIHSWFPMQRLAYSSNSAELRSFVTDRGDDRSWAHPTPGDFIYEDINGNFWARASIKPGMAAGEDDWKFDRLITAGLSLILLGLLYGLIRATSTRVFGLNLIGRLTIEVPNQRLGAEQILLVDAEPLQRRQMERTLAPDENSTVCRIDLLRAPRAYNDESRPLFGWPKRDADLYVIINLDTHHDDPDWSFAKLKLLEDLIDRAPGIKLLVCSAVDPIRWVDAIHPQLPFKKAKDHRERWLRVLGQLHPVHGTAELSLEWMNKRNANQAYLLREVSAHAELAALATINATELNKTQLMDTITASAEPLFRRAWTLSTREERVVMAHMAMGGLPNAGNETLLAGLIRRRLVRRDPDLRLASEAFSKFVATAESTETLTEWRKAKGRDTWSIIRLPLLAVLFVIGAFVVATNGDQFKSTLGIVAAMLGGLPAILQVLNNVRGSGGGG